MNAPVPRVEFAGSEPPTEEGNYLVVNAMNRQQWLAKVHRHEGTTGLRVYNVNDVTCHDLADYHQNEYRWYHIHPLTNEQCAVLTRPEFGLKTPVEA